MSDTTQVAEPTDLAAYLTMPMESPSDAAPVEDLQPATEALDDSQSSPDGDGVATEPDPEQSADADTVEGQEEAGSSEPPVSPSASSVNWDSDENPHYQAAQQLEKIRQLAEEQKAQQEEKEWRDRVVGLGKKLGEVDEDDVSALMGDLVDEVSEHARQPVLRENAALKHAFASLVAAVESESPELRNRIVQTAAYHRENNATADDVERSFSVSKKEREAFAAERKSLNDKIKNLSAELLKAQKQSNGSDRTERTPVGAGTKDYRSVDDMLRDGPL